MKRINQDEFDALKALECVVSLLESKKVRPVLAERLKSVKYGARDLGAAASATRRVMNNIYKTVPEVQRRHLSNNLRSTELRVGVWLKSGRNTSDHGMIISWDDIMVLLDAAFEKCVVCDLNPQEQRKCPLAKVLDAMPGKKNENSKGCGYFVI